MGKQMLEQTELRFDGPAYVHERDAPRLSKQILRVWDCMSDGQWRTLSEIAKITGDPEPSVSAQLRHLRKPRFGQHKVERRYIKNGLFEYKLTVNQE